jgi:hypothetical protein
MRRAQSEFAAAGLQAIAAPTAYETTGPFLMTDLLPGPGGLRAGRIALHEQLGLIVQRLTSP